MEFPRARGGGVKILMPPVVGYGYFLESPIYTNILFLPVRYDLNHSTVPSIDLLNTTVSLFLKKMYMHGELENLYVNIVT